MQRCYNNRMKKRWTIREAALMTLPCVALAALAWWTRDKNLHTENFEFKLQSVEVVPVTPLDVYKGFDTVVKVRWRFPNPPELSGVKATNTNYVLLNERLTYKSRKASGKAQNLELTKVFNIESSYSANGDNDSLFRLRLAKQPAKYGELTLRATMTGAFYEGTRRVVIPPRALAIVVRKNKEIIRVPQVSRYRFFRIKTITVQPPEKNPPRKLIKVTFENLQPGDTDNLHFLRPRLVDARGKEYEHSIKVGKQYVSWVQMSEPADHLVDKRNLVRWFSFPLNLIPKSAGKLTFKTEVSLNDGWPLPVSYVVRP